MDKKSRKALEFERRETEILQTALSLFLKHGLEVVSVDRIARKVGVSKGTIYNHFKNKEEIFAHLFIEQNNKLIQQVNALDQTLPVLDQIRAYVAIYLNFPFDNAAEFRLFQKFKRTLVQSNIGGHLQIRLDAQNRFLHEFAEKLIQKGIDEKILKDIPAKDLVCIGEGVILGVNDAVMDSYFSAEISDRQTFGKILGDVMLNGILRD